MSNEPDPIQNGTDVITDPDSVDEAATERLNARARHLANLEHAGITEAKLAMMFADVRTLGAKWRDAGIRSETAAAHFLGVGIGIMKTLGYPPLTILNGAAYCLENSPSADLVLCVLSFIENMGDHS